eukprot:754524-Hanusia_phi.AAC.1
MDIHALQMEMHKSHRFALGNLTSQLVEVTRAVKNYTDHNLGLVNDEMTKLSAKQEDDSQEALVLLAKKVAYLKQKMQELHNQHSSRYETVMSYSKGVQEGMRHGDSELDAALLNIKTSLGELDRKESEDYNNTLGTTETLNKKILEDHLAVLKKTSDDSADLHKNLLDRLDEERRSINALFAAKKSQIEQSLVNADKNITTSGEQGNAAMGHLISEQLQNNEYRASLIQSLRRKFESTKAKTFHELDHDFGRIDRLFNSLSETEKRMKKQAKDDRAFILSVMNANKSSFESKNHLFLQWLQQGYEALNSTIDDVRNKLSDMTSARQSVEENDVAALSSTISRAIQDVNLTLSERADSYVSDLRKSIRSEAAQQDEKIRQVNESLIADDVTFKAKFRDFISQELKMNSEQEDAIYGLEESSSSLFAAADRGYHGIDQNISTISSKLSEFAEQFVKGMKSNSDNFEQQKLNDINALDSKFQQRIHQEKSKLLSDVQTKVEGLQNERLALQAESAATQSNLRDQLGFLSNRDMLSNKQTQKDLQNLETEQQASIKELDEKVDLLVQAMKDNEKNFHSESQRVRNMQSSMLSTLKEQIAASGNESEASLKQKVGSVHFILHAAMQNSFQTMEDLLSTQRVNIENTYDSLISEMHAQLSTQNDHNLHLSHFLNRITQKNDADRHNAEEDLDQLKAYAAEMQNRLQTQYEELRSLEWQTFNHLNSTREDSAKSLHASVMDKMLANEDEAESEISSSLLALKKRILTLERNSNASAALLSTATSAIQAKILNMHNSRQLSLSDMQRKLSADKVVVDRKIEDLRQQIASYKQAIATKLEANHESQSQTKGKIQDYLDARMDSLARNSSQLIELVRSIWSDQFNQDVQSWQSAFHEKSLHFAQAMSTATEKLKKFKELEQSEDTNVIGRIDTLLSTMTSNKQNIDESVSALNDGLSSLEQKLISTSAELDSGREADKQQVQNEFQKQHQRVQTDYKNAMMEQESKLKASVQADEEGLMEREKRLGLLLNSRWKWFNASLKELQLYEVVEVLSSPPSSFFLAVGQVRGEPRSDRVALAKPSTSCLGAEPTCWKVVGESDSSTSSLRDSQSDVELQHKSSANFQTVLRVFRVAQTLLQQSSLNQTSIAQHEVDAAETKLSSARNAMEMAGDLIRQEHNTDENLIKSDVTTGLTSLESQATRGISDALSAIRGSLTAKLTSLSERVSAMKAKAVQIENEVKSNMTSLEARQALDDSQGTHEITELFNEQQRLEGLLHTELDELQANETDLENSAESRLSSIDTEGAADGRNMQSEIEGSSDDDVKELKRTIDRQKESWDTAMKQGTTAKAGDLQQYRDAEKEALQDITRRINDIEREENADRSKFVESFNQLQVRVDGLQRQMQANMTGIRTNVGNMVRNVTSLQNSFKLQRQTAFAQFDRMTNSNINDITRNFSSQIRDFFTAAEQKLKDKIQSIRSNLDTSRTDAAVEMRREDAILDDLKNKQQSLYNQRLQAVNGLNGTSPTWANSMLNKLQVLHRDIGRAKSQEEAGANSVVNSANALQRDVSSVDATLSRLENLQQQMQNLQSQYEQVRSTDSSSAQASDAKVSSLRTDVTQWRAEVQAAVERLVGLVSGDQKLHLSFQHNTTSELENAKRRMQKIHDDIEELKRNLPPAVSAVPPPARPALRPPLLPGQTPPPEPLNFWWGKTSSESVLLEDGGHIVLGSSMSGYLTGSIDLPHAGRWMVYLTLRAVAGDGSDSIQVTINGKNVGMYQNNLRSGFPCDGRVCLNSNGLYVPSKLVEGDRVDFTFAFRSSNTDPSKHMWLGTGEAAFIGDPAAQPGPVVGSPIRSKVTAMNAVDGKTAAQGKTCSDGISSRGYTMATEPVLWVLDGTALVSEVGGGLVSPPQLTLRADDHEQRQGGCVSPPAGRRQEVHVRAVPGGNDVLLHAVRPQLLRLPPQLARRVCDVAFQATMNLALAPLLKPGECRFVLTWGAQ